MNTKASAIKRITPRTDRLPRTPESIVANNPSSEAENAAPESEQEDDESNHFASADDDLNVPWAEIEEGWKTELKNYLLSADPEKGEEIYSAYLEEKKKFAERIDFSEKDELTNEAPTDAESDAIASDALKSEEMDKGHQDNLKDIFGEHYNQVKALHQEYVESIQYINRSDVEFSIAL